MKKINIALMTSILLPLQFASAAPNILRTDTGFYYPANMKHRDSPYYGYGDRNPDLGNQCHLGNDYKIGEGSPIYAAGEGVVQQVNAAVPSYGSDVRADGGVIVIKHTTASGKIFYALYGHIKDFAVNIGDTVRGGQKIAVVGSYISNGKRLPHLHFGINPETPSFQLHTEKSQCKDLKGFVDPEVYLETQSAKVVAADTCVAVDDSATTVKNTIVTIASVLTNDTDSDADILSVFSAEADSAVGVAITNNNDGTFTYTPPIDFTGVDTFNYTVTDNNGCTDTATVTVHVNDDSSNPANPNPTTPDPTKSSGGGSISSLGLFSLLSLCLMRVFRRKNAKETLIK